VIVHYTRTDATGARFNCYSSFFSKKETENLDIPFTTQLVSALHFQVTQRQTAPSIKAHLIRGAFYVLLLISVSTIPFALGQRQARERRTLTFAERVAYQRAIEEVYWRHRIWPRSRGERPDPKPSLDAVISQAQLEKKVADYLSESQAVEDYWHRPITAKQLQAEMDRMAQHSGTILLS
jgi:hypothetical protein